MKKSLFIWTNFIHINFTLFFIFFNMSFAFAECHTYLSKNTFNIKAFADDGENVWIGGYGQGILRINKNSNEIQLFNNSNSCLQDNHIWSIAADSQKNVWCGSFYGGLAKFDGNEWISCTVTNSDIPDNNVRSVKIDKNGHIWVGTWNGGLAEYDGMTWKKHLHRFHKALFIDSLGNVWAGVNPQCNDQNCTGGGLYKYNGSYWITYDLAHLFSPGDYINDLVVDKNRSAWLATNGLGLLKFDGKWTTYDTTNSPLLSNDVSSLTLDKNDNIWLVNISRWEREATIFKFDSSNWMKINSSLPFNDISSIFADANKNIWIANESGGLSCYDGDQWTIYQTGN